MSCHAFRWGKSRPSDGRRLAQSNATRSLARGSSLLPEVILRMLGRRHAVDSLIEAYPELSAEDIHAAQAFAADYPASGRILAAE